MDARSLNVDKRSINVTIPEYFAGKNVLVTGFTGFMGKYLLMTLLSECPDVGNIYLLMRETRMMTIKQKLEKALANPLFNQIRSNNEAAFNKLKLVEGDLTEIGLGLAEEDRTEIIENVSIVYHVAASVRFDMPLRDAILLNVRGTRELCSLVLTLKNPLAFLHVSTSYCQIDKKAVEEIIYPPHDNWRQAIAIAETLNQFELNILCAKYIEAFPNTYTFTKSLAETAVRDMCRGKVPTIIFRPTVVVSALKGPIPGWSDNFNGPIGLFIGLGKGIIRSVYGSQKSKYDFIPVDFAINSMIKSVWIQQFLKHDEISVYNCSCHKLCNIDHSMLIKYGRQTYKEVTYDPVWHANIEVTENQYMHYVSIILLHVLPAVLADTILRAAGKKPMLLKVQRKVYNASNAINYFMRHSWDFYNYKCTELDGYLLPSDISAFSNNWTFNHQHFFDQAARIAQVILMKEDPAKRDLYKKKRLKLKYIHNTLKYTALSSCLMFLPNNLIPSIGNYFLSYHSVL